MSLKIHSHTSVLHLQIRQSMQTSLVNHKLRLIKAYHSYSGSISAPPLPLPIACETGSPPPLLPATSGNRSTDLSGMQTIFSAIWMRKGRRAHLAPHPPFYPMDNKKGKREPREQWRTPCGGWVVSRQPVPHITWIGLSSGTVHVGLLGKTVFRSAMG